MGKSKRDKTTGLPLPSPVVPSTSVCFTISVPNAKEYKSALMGALSSLGQAWTWSQTVGQDNQGAYDAAELWRQRIYESSFSDDCEVEMSCDDVADCIETSEAVQDAISQYILNNPVIEGDIYNTPRYGVPMSPTQLNTPVVTSIDCDRDSLFGSVTAIVDQMDRNNRDFLEIIEVGTNTRERISQLIAAIPGFETLPINEAIDYIDKLQSEILENYEAQWTDALRDTYRCDLFCKALDDPECELTFDDIYGYFETRLGAALDPINLFQSFVQYFTLGTWSGTLVVDIMMLNQVAIWRATSNYIGISLRSLETVGLLGANDNDPDWEILCEDCPSSECTNYDFAEDGEQGWTGEFGTEFLEGGWRRSIYNNSSIYLASVPHDVSRITARWTAGNPSSGVIYDGPISLNILGTLNYDVGANAWVAVLETPIVEAHSVMIHFTGPIGDDWRLADVELCV